MNKKNEDNAMFILFGGNVECYWRCFFVILIPEGFFFFRQSLPPVFCLRYNQSMSTNK